MLDEDITPNDAHFCDILENCLQAEIKRMEDKCEERGREINTLKGKVQQELEERKKMKGMIGEGDNQLKVLSIIERRLQKDVGKIIQDLEMAKANMDNEYKLETHRLEKFNSICNKYENSWNLYKKEYEEMPLAKAKKETENVYDKLCIEEKIIMFKTEKQKKIKKQKDDIDWQRTCIHIIEFAQAMVNRKLQQLELQQLNKEIHKAQMELENVKKEVAILKRIKKEEREANIFKKPLPGIDFPNLDRVNISQKCSRKRICDFDDVISVNSTLLQHMCSKGDSTKSDTLLEEAKEIQIDVETHSPISTLLNANAKTVIKENSNASDRSKNIITTEVIDKSDKTGKLVDKSHNSRIIVSNNVIESENFIIENTDEITIPNTIDNDSIAGTDNETLNVCQESYFDIDDTRALNKTNEKGINEDTSENIESLISSKNKLVEDQEMNNYKYILENNCNVETANSTQATNLRVPQIKSIEKVAFHLSPLQKHTQIENNNLLDNISWNQYDFCECDISVDLEEEMSLTKGRFAITDESISKYPSDCSNISPLRDTGDDALSIQYPFNTNLMSVEKNYNEMDISKFSEIGCSEPTDNLKLF